MHTGYPLRLKQEDIGINGWAVEARVYAEVGLNIMQQRLALCCFVPRSSMKIGLGMRLSETSIARVSCMYSL